MSLAFHSQVPMQRQSTMHVEKRVQSNVDEQHRKIFQERDNIIRRFTESLQDPAFRSSRGTLVSKTYQDGSRYEGEMTNEQRHGRGIY